MANHLMNATAGTAGELSVDYESDNGGVLHIRCSSGFEVEPASQTVPPASSGSVTISMKLRRTTATTLNCVVTIVFYNDQRRVLVEVP